MLKRVPASPLARELSTERKRETKMPFTIASQQEIDRVKEAIDKRDVSILQSAKERLICYGHAMKRYPDLIKQLDDLKTPPVNETEESDQKDAYIEALSIFGGEDGENKPRDPVQQVLETKAT